MLSNALHEEDRESYVQAFEAIFASQSPPLSSVTLRCAYFQGVASSLSDHVLIEALGMALLEDITDAGAGTASSSGSSGGGSAKESELAYNAVIRALCRDDAEDENATATAAATASGIGAEKGKAKVRAGAGAGFSSVPLDNSREAVTRAHGLVRPPLFTPAGFNLTPISLYSPYSVY